MPKVYAYVLPDGTSGLCFAWTECEKVVKGVSGAKYLAFKTQEDAQGWLDSQSFVGVKPAGDGVYFDSGTGRGKGVEIKVTDQSGNNLLPLLHKPNKLTPHGTLLLNGKTNNYGELMALSVAMEIAVLKGVLDVFGDSRLVIDYWSRGHIKIDEPGTVKLAKKVSRQRSDFEKKGGSVNYVSGDVNPADLGFHVKKGRNYKQIYRTVHR